MPSFFGWWFLLLLFFFCFFYLLFSAFYICLHAYICPCTTKLYLILKHPKSKAQPLHNRDMDVMKRATARAGWNIRDTHNIFKWKKFSAYKFDWDEVVLVAVVVVIIVVHRIRLWYLMWDCKRNSVWSNQRKNKHLVDSSFFFSFTLLIFLCVFFSRVVYIVRLFVIVFPWLSLAITNWNMDLHTQRI